MKRLGITGLSMVSAIALSACAADESTRMTQLQQELDATQQQNVMLQEANVDLENQIAVLKETDPDAQAGMSSDPLLLPPEARSGECFARVFVPPTYQSQTEKVLKTEASDRVEIEPAQYSWVEETVLVKEESERVEVIPATYKTVTEKVLVSQESEKLETVPAVYDTVTEKVLVKEAYTTWKKGRGPIEKIDHATGEIMCLVEVPAEYKTVTKRVLVTPAQTRVVKIPAEYETVTKQVVDTPATTRMVKIPPVYDTMKVRKLVTPAKERRIEIPATYQTVSKTVKASEGQMEWRPILCETNTTPLLVSRLQTALATKGYDPGPIDGVLGPDTMSAVSAFQRKNNLVTGQLTLETVEALGVKP